MNKKVFLELLNNSSQEELIDMKEALDNFIQFQQDNNEEWEE